MSAVARRCMKTRNVRDRQIARYVDYLCKLDALAPPCVERWYNRGVSKYNRRHNLSGTSVLGSIEDAVKEAHKNGHAHVIVDGVLLCKFCEADVDDQGICDCPEDLYVPRNRGGN